jgi:hypothetical protein
MKTATTRPMTTGRLAALALDAARKTPEAGRYGETKVFVHAAWAVGEFFTKHGLTLDEFKARLVEANRLRLLDLSRADLVEAMSAYDVKRSATADGAAVFNFIRL